MTVLQRKYTQGSKVSEIALVLCQLCELQAPTLSVRGRLSPKAPVCDPKAPVCEEGCWRPWHRKVLPVSLDPLVNAEDDHVGRPGTFLSFEECIGCSLNFSV